MRFWRLTKVSIPVFGSGTLPTPGVFTRKVCTIQSPWIKGVFIIEILQMESTNQSEICQFGRQRERESDSEG